MQTGYAVVGDFSQADPVVYDRFVAVPNFVGWIITVCTGSSSDSKMVELCMYIPPRTVIRLISYDFLRGVDFTPPTAAGRVFDKTAPVIVALHGLTGGTLM